MEFNTPNDRFEQDFIIRYGLKIWKTGPKIPKNLRKINCLITKILKFSTFNSLFARFCRTTVEEMILIVCEVSNFAFVHKLVNTRNYFAYQLHTSFSCELQ